MFDSLQQNPKQSDDAEFLVLVGSRVRQIRSKRGMSRRLLAEISGISERYLAQLENGTGNASVLVLKAIADATHVPVDDLLDPQKEQSTSYFFLRNYLRRAHKIELENMIDTLRGKLTSSEFFHMQD